jgi:hypothetical protein
MQHQHKRGLRISVVLGAAAATAGLSWGCGSDADNAPTGGALGARGGSGGSGGTIGVTGGSAGKSSGSGGSIAIGGTGSGATGATGNVGGMIPPDAECASVSRQSNKAVVALLFMVDVSGSMYCTVPEPNPDQPCTGHSSSPDQGAASWRWNEVVPALKDFFSSPSSSGMWAGIDFFSGDVSCDAADYEQSNPEIALLPGAATAINAAIDQQDPSGQTPTVPSLEGATRHAQAWEAAHPDHQVVIVYATDGYPQGCGNGNNIGNAVQVAADAYDGNPSIPTYVLGVGPNLDDLDRIAASGGTDQAFHIDTSSANVTAALTDAFNSIRSDVAVDCTYNLPSPPAGQTLDLQAVNVNYTSGTGQETLVGFNASANCTEGWQYANGNTQIVLCGSTCDTVKADPGAKIDVAFGCTTIVVDVPK